MIVRLDIESLMIKRLPTNKSMVPFFPLHRASNIVRAPMLTPGSAGAVT